jgi:glycine cleavage system H protein
VALPIHPQQNIYYKRSRFTTWLPPGHRYTESHYWLFEFEPGIWRVGFTRFATRMLGDLVEHGFNVQAGETVAVGQAIAWVEGFKAISDVYSVARGEFLGGNPALLEDVSLVDAKGYDEGWLYAVRGEPDTNSLDVNGYIKVLDATIDRLRSKYE